jgi:hypothetical protein
VSSGAACGLKAEPANITTQGYFGDDVGLARWPQATDLPAWIAQKRIFVRRIDFQKNFGN